MNKKVRPVIIDGVEIQTGLSAVEIANLPQINAEQQKEIDKYKNIIDELAIWLINQSKDYKDITKYDKCLEKLNELEDEK